MSPAWSAIGPKHWHLTEQAPCHLRADDRAQGEPPAAGPGDAVQIVRVKPTSFFGSHAYRAGVRSRHGSTKRRSWIARQAVWRRVGQVADALLLGDGDLDWDRATRYLRRFGAGSVVKRLGFLVEYLGMTHPPEPRMLDEWLGLLTAGISKLDPSTPREPHRIATRWRVAVNLPEEGLRRWA